MAVMPRILRMEALLPPKPLTKESVAVLHNRDGAVNPVPLNRKCMK